jgi:plasmid stabilization system protein ParE
MILLSREAIADIARLRAFLDEKNDDAAKRALQTIWSAFEKVQNFPELGRPTEDHEIRQIVIPFGNAGYVSRYTIVPNSNDVLILRIWHGREMRP